MKAEADFQGGRDPGSEIVPFRVAISQGALDDLKRWLSSNRLPDKETVLDWSQSVPLEKARTLLDYWRERYDWRAFESRVNELPQFRTVIDGLGIHFFHIRSPHADALPMILTHGWPGSFVEFLEVMTPLTDPTRYGGNPLRRAPFPNSVCGAPGTLPVDFQI